MFSMFNALEDNFKLAVKGRFFDSIIECQSGPVAAVNDFVKVTVGIAFREEFKLMSPNEQKAALCLGMKHQWLKLFAINNTFAKMKELLDDRCSNSKQICNGLTKAFTSAAGVISELCTIHKNYKVDLSKLSTILLQSKQLYNFKEFIDTNQAKIDEALKPPLYKCLEDSFVTLFHKTTEDIKAVNPELLKANPYFWESDFWQAKELIVVQYVKEYGSWELHS